MNFYLYYQIGPIKFATPIEEIKEIARAKNLITENDLPKNIAGLFDLRGRRICVFDLPAFLGIIPDKDFEIVIVKVNEQYIGFKVEKIFSIVSADEIKSYPKIAKAKDYLKGIIIQDKDLIQIISLVKILSGQRLKPIQKYL